MSYYIDQIIAGVQDYLGTKGLTINPSSLDNPKFYYMFGENPANWHLGPHLISTDGSDIMLNPTYLALSSNNWYNPNITLEGNRPDGSLTLQNFENISDINNLTLSPTLLSNAKNNNLQTDNSKELLAANLVLIFSNSVSTALKNKQKTEKQPVQTNTDSIDKEKEENHNPDVIELDNYLKEPSSTLKNEQKIEKQPVQTNTDSPDTEKQNEQSDETTKPRKNEVKEQTEKEENHNPDVIELDDSLKEPSSTLKNEQKTEKQPVQTNTDSPDTEKQNEQSDETTKPRENEVKEQTEKEENHNPDVIELDDSSKEPSSTSENKQKTEKQPIQTNTDSLDTEKQNEQSDETTNNHKNNTIKSDETDDNEDKNSVKTKTTKPSLALNLNNLNNKIQQLNKLQQTTLETEQNQPTEETNENKEADLKKKEEIARAVQNFDQGIYDIEDGFNLLITDENGNPSPLYYVVENGVYHRLDDATKKPIDTTKSQLKLTENEYKSYLAELNNKKKENEILSETEIDTLVTDNLTTVPLVDTQQTGTEEKQVYVPQTPQSTVSTVSTQPQSNPQQANDVQSQNLTSEQQAQMQQQALLQDQQQKKEDEKANFLVKTGRWIQENVFDTIGNALPIPLLGTGIKMFGNVFTGLLKTIGHIFDGNWKKMASDGWSWLKDSAIIGGVTFGAYKLGESLDWWGKDKNKNKSNASATKTDNLSDKQIASLAEKAITGKSGVFSSSTKPLTTLANAQSNIAENNGVSDALRKTASIAAQTETTADIIQQNTKTMG